MLDTIPLCTDPSIPVFNLLDITIEVDENMICSEEINKENKDLQ